MILDQKRSSSKSPDVASTGGYATNFGAGLGGPPGGIPGVSANSATASVSATASALASATAASASAAYGGMGYGGRNIEGQIMACVFKTLVTRFVKSYKELKSQENLAIYCDIRQFMMYVKEAHGGVFRRVALSGILDSSDRPNKRCNSNVRTTRVIRYFYFSFSLQIQFLEFVCKIFGLDCRHIHQTDYDDNADLAGDSCYTVDDRGTRKCLFKKRSTSSTCAVC